MKRIILCMIFFISCSSENKIKLVKPIRNAGIVTSTIGHRWGALHTGVDIAVKKGTLVRALTDGVVTRSSYDRTYGNRINIFHPALGLHSSYSHLSRMNYKEGDKILAGDIIGTVGNTGHSTGPHLHYEIYNGSVFLNPLDIVGNTYLHRYRGKKIEIAKMEKKNEVEEKNLDITSADEI